MNNSGAQYAGVVAQSSENETPGTGGPVDTTIEFPKSASFNSNMDSGPEHMMQFAGLMSRCMTWTSWHASTARANDRIHVCTVLMACPLTLRWMCCKLQIPLSMTMMLATTPHSTLWKTFSNLMT